MWYQINIIIIVCCFLVVFRPPHAANIIYHHQRLTKVKQLQIRSNKYNLAHWAGLIEWQSLRRLHGNWNDKCIINLLKSNDKCSTEIPMHFVHNFIQQRRTSMHARQYSRSNLNVLVPSDVVVDVGRCEIYAHGNGLLLLRCLQCSEIEPQNVVGCNICRALCL